VRRPDLSILLVVWGGLLLVMVIGIALLVVMNRRRLRPLPRPRKYREMLEERFAAMRADRRASAKRPAPRGGEPPAPGPRASP